jgi:hypothetical protein
MLSKEDMERMGLNDKGRWTAMCLAFSALGKQITGLNIDFQIQEHDTALEMFSGEPRVPLGLVALRYSDARQKINSLAERIDANKTK